MTNIKYLDLENAGLQGSVRISGSKSISNRVLVIRALAGAYPLDTGLIGLATAKDTAILYDLLEHRSTVYNAQDAGTSYRFLTAYLAIQKGTKILTGTARMQERPIAPLVDALRLLGANIAYQDKEGFPPLLLDAPNPSLFNAISPPNIVMDASTSSQFVSAILLIAPMLPHGLRLTLSGQLVSLPYLDMTIRLMQYFGIEIDRNGHFVLVKHGNYTIQPFQIEPDWSAASYYYSAVALANEGAIYLKGLTENSLQGDAVVAKIYTSLGVHTDYEADGIRLTKQPHKLKPMLQYDFTHCPDIAQTVIVTCAALGVQGVFAGLESLIIKETNRIVALKTELAKIGVTFTKLPPHFSKKQPEKTFYLLEGKAIIADTPTFHTYHDHRMAMSFAPLALLGNIGIESPEVVEKSYTEYWKDMEQIAQINNI